MERKIKILIFLNIILVLIIFGIFTLNIDFSPQTNPSELEECKTLEYNKDSGINIVFFSTKKQAEEYVNFFKTISPLSEYPDNFNFYYIDGYTPLCEIYQDTALLCYDKETIKKSASCPNDFIVVLKEDDRQIRSSAYMNVMSLNTKHPLTVIAHEFGHVFVNFAEEYVPAPLPKNSKNCVDECQKFDIKEGCYPGCSKETYFRSINNGIMRTLSSTNYGIFNERIIVEKILEIAEKRKTSSAILTGNVIKDTECINKNYYLIEGQYTGSEIEIKGKKIELGCMNDQGSGDFEYNLLTEDNKKLVGQFNPELIYTDAQEEKDNQIQGEVLTSNKEFILKLPITENPKSLTISKQGIVLSTVDFTTSSTEEINQRPCAK